MQTRTARAVELAVGGLIQLAPTHEISIKLDTYPFRGRGNIAPNAREDSPALPGAPLFVWVGVLGVKPTKGTTVGFIGEGQDVARFLKGKGAAINPPIDSLKVKDCLRA
jgi:hypothetical protein